MIELILCTILLWVLCSHIYTVPRWDPWQKGASFLTALNQGYSVSSTIKALSETQRGLPGLLWKSSGATVQETGAPEAATISLVTRYFPKENTSFSSSCAFTVNSWFIMHVRGRTEIGKVYLKENSNRFLYNQSCEWLASNWGTDTDEQRTKVICVWSRKQRRQRWNPRPPGPLLCALCRTLKNLISWICSGTQSQRSTWPCALRAIHAHSTAAQDVIHPNKCRMKQFEPLFSLCPYGVRQMPASSNAWKKSWWCREEGLDGQNACSAVGIITRSWFHGERVSMGGRKVTSSSEQCKAKASRWGSTWREPGDSCLWSPAYLLGQL